MSITTSAGTVTTTCEGRQDDRPRGNAGLVGPDLAA